MESTQATGSPVEAHGTSVAELWATYEGLDAEFAFKQQQADRCWSAHEEALQRERECWNAAHAAYLAHASELWRRTTIAISRTLSRHARSHGGRVRLSFRKVAEYQRRGSCTTTP